MAAAGNDGGQKRTSFPCLATARYTVAAVVSVLTVVVVVMVTIVALRPEKVIFSITSQPIEARPPWWDVNLVQVNPNLSFLVSLTAHNPSGRADVSVEDVTIRVLDMPGYYDYGWSPYSSFQTLKEIIFAYEMQANFSVSRQTSHTLWKWILVHNPAVLSYLAHRYGGSVSFTAMVQVNATMNGKRSSKPQIYYCWPVIVVVGGGWWSSSSYDRTTSCLPEKEMDFNVSFSEPAPVPVPAPAPAPAPMAPARYY